MSLSQQTTPKKKMGRKPIPLDKEQILRLAQIHCTNEEIAAVMGVSADTIERRFAGDIKENREKGRSSLRRLLWKSAEHGSVTMQIWLSKQLLGMRDPEPLIDKELAKGVFNKWWDQVNDKSKSKTKANS